MKKTLGVFLVIILVAGACLDEPDCYLLNNNVVGIAFKNLSDPAADAPISVTRMGALQPPMAPLLFFQDTSFARLNLLLNYFEDETTYFFEEPDTLRFLRLGYLSQAQFVSEDCGERYFLSKLRVLDHNFDSVRLIIEFPSREGGALHLQIFR